MSIETAHGDQVDLGNESLLPLQMRRDALVAMESPTAEEAQELADIRAALGE